MVKSRGKPELCKEVIFMKRSEINAALREMEQMVREYYEAQ